MADCLTCGATIQQGNRFCTNCGQPVEARPAAVAAIPDTAPAAGSRAPQVIKAAIRAGARSLAISALLLSPGVFLLSAGWVLAGMAWMFFASFGLMAWTYRRPWRLGLVSSLIPPVAAAACYLVQLWLLSDSLPPLALGGPAVLLGIAVGFLNGRSHRVYDKDGAIFAERTIGYLVVWVVAFALTQSIALLSTNLWAIRAGLLTGAFSTALLATVSIMLWRRKAATAAVAAKPAMAAAAVLLALTGAVVPATRTQAGAEPGFSISAEPQSAGALLVLEDLVPKMVPEWQRVFANDTTDTADFVSIGQPSGNADSASVVIVFYGALKVNGTLESEGRLETTLTIERFASAEAATPPMTAGTITVGEDDASRVSSIFEARGPLIVAPDYVTVMSSNGPYRATAHSKLQSWNSTDDLTISLLGSSALVISTVNQFIDINLPPEGGADGGAVALPGGVAIENPFAGVELSSEADAAAAAIIAALVAAGIAANVAQAIAMSVASALQAAGQLTADDIQEAVAEALLQEHDGPLMEDGTTVPPEPPPPILRPDGTPFETNDEGQYWVPEGEGGHWGSREEALLAAADLQAAVNNREAEIAAHDDAAAADLDQSRLAREERMRADGYGLDPDSGTWRKLPERPELEPLPDTEGIRYGTDWKPGLFGADVDTSTLDGTLDQLNNLEEDALKQYGDLDRRIEQAEASGDDWLADRLKEDRERLRDHIGEIQGRKADVTGAIEDENRRVAEFDRTVEQVTAGDVAVELYDGAKAILSNPRVLVEDPDFVESVKRGIAAAEEVRRGEGIELRPGLVGYEEIKVAQSVRERYEASLTRVADLDARLEEARQNGNTTVVEALTAELAAAKVEARQLSADVRQHARNVRAWETRSALANLSLARKGAEVAGTVASIQPAARAATNLIGDIDQGRGMFSRTIKATDDAIDDGFEGGADGLPRIKVERGGPTVGYDAPPDPSLLPPERSPWAAKQPPKIVAPGLEPSRATGRANMIKPPPQLIDIDPDDMPNPTGRVPSSGGIDAEGHDLPEVDVDGGPQQPAWIDDLGDVPAGTVPEFGPEFDPPATPPRTPDSGADVPSPPPPDADPTGTGGPPPPSEPVPVAQPGTGPRSARPLPPSQMVERDGRIVIEPGVDPDAPPHFPDGADAGHTGQVRPPDPDGPDGAPPAAREIRPDPRVRAIDEVHAHLDAHPELRNDRYINMSSERAQQMDDTGLLQPATETGGASDEVFATSRGAGPAGYLSHGDTTHVVRVPAANTVDVGRVADGRFFDAAGNEIPAETVRGRIIALRANEGTGDRLWYVTPEGKLRPEIPRELVRRWRSAIGDWEPDP